MQFRNLFLAACVAATASAAGNGTSNSTDIAPSVQNRLVQLEIGYLKTNLMLDQVANNIGDTTIDVSFFPFEVYCVDYETDCQSHRMSSLRT